MAGGSIAAVAENALKGKDITVSKEEHERRMAVCAGCPKMKTLAGQPQCEECGCLLTIKSQLDGMKCPLNKW